jgi:hypothetical protein
MGRYPPKTPKEEMMIKLVRILVFLINNYFVDGIKIILIWFSHSRIS